MEQGLKSSFHYDRCYKIFTKLYENLTANPTQVSLEEREKKDLISDTTYTYGEVNFYSFVQILELAAPKAGDIFYDLGSGAGKAVFIAWLVGNFGKVLGVEKLQSLYDLSLTLCDKLRAIPEVEQLKKDPNTIKFLNQDILETDFSDGDIIFLQSTCFSGHMWDGIMAKLQKLKPGTRVIVSTKLLNMGGFELKHQKLFLMSWGLSRVSIYERI